MKEFDKRMSQVFVGFLFLSFSHRQRVECNFVTANHHHHLLVHILQT